MFHPQGPTFWELARQALSSTEQGYDLLAPKFDYTPFRTPDFVLEQAARCLANRGEIDDAVDICCGTGAGMEMLSPLAKSVVGLDMSQGMLDVARENSQSWTPGARLDFRRANLLDAESLDDLKGSFDAAVCFGALGHITARDQPVFLRHVHNLLRPGGRFVFATAMAPPWYSLRSVVARSFNAAMHIRNLLIRPPFIMFYLTFMLPGIQADLEQAGFQVRVHEGEFPPGLHSLRIVEAVKQP